MKLRKISLKEFRELLKENIKEEVYAPLESTELNQILMGYIESALWTEEENLKDQQSTEYKNYFRDDEDDEEDDDLEKLIRISQKKNQKSLRNFVEEDIEDNSRIQAYLDIKKFIEFAGFESIKEAIIENGLERLGHDIWLTRNGHGAGFFDHGYSDETEKSLMNASKKIGSVDMFIDNNEKIAFSNAN